MAAWSTTTTAILTRLSDHSQGLHAYVQEFCAMEERHAEATKVPGQQADAIATRMWQLAVTLTIADIKRWDAGDVREVFHAASSRAQAVQDAANGLAELPAFTTWGGDADEAAKEAMGKTRADLDVHGQGALGVANAARSAADEIERIKSELATLKADAAALGMEIDPVSGQVGGGPGTSGNPMEVFLKQQ